jgi:tetratricopeptide (TPR) repeat protein
MGTRDLLLLIGFLRSGKMFPTAVPFKNLPAQRSLKIVHDGMAEQERAIFGKPSRPIDRDDIKRRSALTSWSGAPLSVGTRIGEVPDPGVILCLLYDVPASEAPLPFDVFAQTLRRYALRDGALRARFDEHVDEAGTYVPAWLSPEVRRQKSQEVFDAAMRVAREHGFAHAAPLFEGVRGDCFPQAQIAIAVHELRELGDNDSALRRLNEVVRVAPRNVAARMQRARIMLKDSGRKVEAATDFLVVLRELARPETTVDSGGPASAFVPPSREVREAAMEGLWQLHREFANARKLEAALTLSKQDPERGFEALSRYVHTHPCAWDAQAHLASLALTRQRFDLTVKLLHQVRWLFPDDPNPHFVYGQALASKGNIEAALAALEHAVGLSPQDNDIQKWLAFAKKKLNVEQQASLRTPSVSVADHVARSLFLLVGIVRYGRVYPAGQTLHKLPGDVSLAIVMQTVGQLEQRRFGSGSPESSREVDLRAVGERTRLCDLDGEAISVEGTVGDVPDPGVVVAIVYDEVHRDDFGRPTFEPTPAKCHATLLGIARQDSELAAKLERHQASPDATLKQRLEL